MDDIQAISAILRGDKNRYEELVARHKKMVYAIAWSHLGNRELSEDAAQETFVKAYCYLGTLREPGKFSWWVARIARNVCNSFRRKMNRETAFTKRWAVLESAEPQEQDVSRGSLEEQLWESFARLPDIHREALTIFYIEGKSVRESADLLGISESAIRARLNRARTALREQLEQRLEDTLDSLQPTEGFTRSVMVLLPLSPKGAIGTGSALAGLGKLSASISFAVWSALMKIGLFSGVMLWYAKAESANIKDTPDNQFRKNSIRRNAILVIVMAAVILPVSTMFFARFGMETVFRALALFMLWGIWQSSRLLRVNTSKYAIAQLCTGLIMFAAFAAIGFADAPYLTFIAAMLIVNVVLFLTWKQMPRRMDYNLFLRCATGGVTQVGVEHKCSMSQLDDMHLRWFAMFLGEQWLVRDYTLDDRGIVLFLPAVRMTLWNMLGKLDNSSRITITRAGDCAAEVSSRELEAIRRLTGRETDKEELKEQVCNSIQYALHCFMSNDLPAARSALTAKADDTVFAQTPERAKHWRTLFIISIAGGLLAMLALILSTAMRR